MSESSGDATEAKPTAEATVSKPPETPVRSSPSQKTVLPEVSEGIVARAKASLAEKRRVPSLDLTATPRQLRGLPTESPTVAGIKPGTVKQRLAFFSGLAALADAPNSIDEKLAEEARQIIREQAKRRSVPEQAIHVVVEAVHSAQEQIYYARSRLHLDAIFSHFNMMTKAAMLISDRRLRPSKGRGAYNVLARAPEAFLELLGASPSKASPARASPTKASPTKSGTSTPQDSPRATPPGSEEASTDAEGTITPKLKNTLILNEADAQIGLPLWSELILPDPTIKVAPSTVMDLITECGGSTLVLYNMCRIQDYLPHILRPEQLPLVLKVLAAPYFAHKALKIEGVHILPQEAVARLHDKFTPLLCLDDDAVRRVQSQLEERGILPIFAKAVILLQERESTEDPVWTRLKEEFDAEIEAMGLTEADHEALQGKRFEPTEEYLSMLRRNALYAFTKQLPPNVSTPPQVVLGTQQLQGVILSGCEKRVAAGKKKRPPTLKALQELSKLQNARDEPLQLVVLREAELIYHRVKLHEMLKHAAQHGIIPDGVGVTYAHVEQMVCAACGVQAACQFLQLAMEKQLKFGYVNELCALFSALALPRIVLGLSEAPNTTPNSLRSILLQGLPSDTTGESAEQLYERKVQALLHAARDLALERPIEREASPTEEVEATLKTVLTPLASGATPLVGVEGKSIPIPENAEVQLSMLTASEKPTPRPPSQLDTEVQGFITKTLEEPEKLLFIRDSQTSESDDAKPIVSYELLEAHAVKEDVTSAPSSLTETSEVETKTELPSLVTDDLIASSIAVPTPLSRTHTFKALVHAQTATTRFTKALQRRRASLAADNEAKAQIDKLSSSQQNDAVSEQSERKSSPSSNELTSAVKESEPTPAIEPSKPTLAVEASEPAPANEASQAEPAVETSEPLPAPEMVLTSEPPEPVPALAISEAVPATEPSKPVPAAETSLPVSEVESSKPAEVTKSEESQPQTEIATVLSAVLPAEEKVDGQAARSSQSAQFDSPKQSGRPAVLETPVADRSPEIPPATVLFTPQVSDKGQGGRLSVILAASSPDEDEYYRTQGILNRGAIAFANALKLLKKYGRNVADLEKASFLHANDAPTAESGMPGDVD